LADAKLFGDQLLVDAKGLHFQHGLDHWFSQFAAGVDRPNNVGIPGRLAVAPFGPAIGHVLGIGAQEQVVRVAARRLVAAMADKQAVRDRAAKVPIGDAVGAVVSSAAATNADDPITGLVQGSGEDPAPGDWYADDARHHALNCRLCRRHRVEKKKPHGARLMLAHAGGPAK
jgi:hypothetical protein